MVVVWRSISRANSASRSGGQRQASSTPGRSFFIWMASVQASSAPALRSASSAKPISSPVMSSRLQLSCTALPAASSPSPSSARTQLAHSKSFVPMP